MHEPLSVLIVEDDPHVLLGCQQALSLEDIPSIGVGSAEEALQQIGDNFAGIVISDIRLPGIDGLQLLAQLKARDRSLPVVLITGHGDISMAVGAMRDGAYDFMEKPFSPERLVDVTRRALEQRRLAREVAQLRRQLSGTQDLAERLLGRSPAMQALRELIAFFFRGLEGAADLGAGRVNVQGWGEALVNPPLRETLQRVMAKYLAALTAIVRRAQSAGQLDPTLDPQAFGRILLSIYYGFELQKALDPAVEVPAYAAAVQALLTAASRGGSGGG